MGVMAGEAGVVAAMAGAGVLMRKNAIRLIRALQASTLKEKRYAKYKNCYLGLGLFSAVTFVLVFFWGLVMPESLHMKDFLELVLPAFKWLTWWGFCLGLLESFLYGVYTGLVFCPIYNALYRFFRKESAHL